MFQSTSQKNVNVIILNFLWLMLQVRIFLLIVKQSVSNWIIIDDPVLWLYSLPPAIRPRLRYLSSSVRLRGGEQHFRTIHLQPSPDFPGTSIQRLGCLDAILKLYRCRSYLQTDQLYLFNADAVQM